MRHSGTFPSRQSHPTHEEQFQAEVPAEMEEEEQEQFRQYSTDRQSFAGETLLFLCVWGSLVTAFVLLLGFLIWYLP